MSDEPHNSAGLNPFDWAIRNQVRLTEDLATGREVWQSRPLTLEFSTNNICNLRCKMCAQHDGLPVIKADPEFSRRVLDEILPGAAILSPMALSEPLAGDIDLYMEKCQEHGAFLNLITNGTLFKEEKLRRVMPSTHRLFVSFECFDKEVFEDLRVNAKYERVLENVKLAQGIAAEHGVPMALVTIFMRPIHERLPEYFREAAALGIKDIVILELLDTFPRYRDYEIRESIPEERLIELRDEAIEAAQKYGLNVDFNMNPPLNAISSNASNEPRITPAELTMRIKTEVQRQHGHFCHHAATYVKVDPEGQVFPCCRAPEELVMGNMHEQSFGEIWNGEKYRDLRRRMHSGDLPECCKGCAVLEGTPFYRKPGDPSPGELDALGRVQA